MSIINGIEKTQKLILYGSTGLLGSRIRELLRDKFKIVGPPHSHLDLTNKKDVLRHLKDVMPDKVIYTAGVTKIDYAQQNPKEAFKMNALVVDFIAKSCAKLNIPVYYISTDAVFDGKTTNRSFKEIDSTEPISIYGKSKLMGERAVLDASGLNCVVRTVMIYSANFPHRKDFARAAYESLSNGMPFAGIIDQEINPTYVDDIVNAISVLIENNAKGIYHVASIDHLKNYQFVVKISEAFGFDKRLIKKTTFDKFFSSKKAPRSKYSTLDTAKFRKRFGENILKTTSKSLNEFKKQISMLESSPIDI